MGYTYTYTVVYAPNDIKYVKIISDGIDKFWKEGYIIHKIFRITDNISVIQFAKD